MPLCRWCNIKYEANLLGQGTSIATNAAGTGSKVAGTVVSGVALLEGEAATAACVGGTALVGSTVAVAADVAIVGVGIAQVVKGHASSGQKDANMVAQGSVGIGFGAVSLGLGIGGIFCPPLLIASIVTIIAGTVTSGVVGVTVDGLCPFCRGDSMPPSTSKLLDMILSMVRKSALLRLKKQLKESDTFRLHLDSVFQALIKKTQVKGEEVEPGKLVAQLSSLLIMLSAHSLTGTNEVNKIVELLDAETEAVEKITAVEENNASEIMDTVETIIEEGSNDISPSTVVSSSGSPNTKPVTPFIAYGTYNQHQYIPEDSSDDEPLNDDPVDRSKYQEVVIFEVPSSDYESGEQDQLLHTESESTNIDTYGEEKSEVSITSINEESTVQEKRPSILSVDEGQNLVRKKKRSIFSRRRNKNTNAKAHEILDQVDTEQLLICEKEVIQEFIAVVEDSLDILMEMESRESNKILSEVTARQNKESELKRQQSLEVQINAQL